MFECDSHELGVCGYQEPLIFEVYYLWVDGGWCGTVGQRIILCSVCQGCECCLSDIYGGRSLLHDRRHLYWVLAEAVWVDRDDLCNLQDVRMLVRKLGWGACIVAPRILKRPTASIAAVPDAIVVEDKHGGKSWTISLTSKSHLKVVAYSYCVHSQFNSVHLICYSTNVCSWAIMSSMRQIQSDVNRAWICGAWSHIVCWRRIKGSTGYKGWYEPNRSYASPGRIYWPNLYRIVSYALWISWIILSAVRSEVLGYMKKMWLRGILSVESFLEARCMGDWDSAALVCATWAIKLELDIKLSTGSSGQVFRRRVLRHLLPSTHYNIISIYVICKRPVEISVISIVSIKIFVVSGDEERSNCIIMLWDGHVCVRSLMIALVVSVR